MSHGGVYVIANRITGDLYVGSAVDFCKRWEHHRNSLRRSDHHNPILQRAWDKYGPGAFEFRAEFVCEPEECIFWEQLFIDMWQPEYNMAPTAGNCLGRKHSDETRAKMSASATGVPLSEEGRAKVSAAMKGKKRDPFTEEHRAKMSAALIGNTRWLGKKHKPETIEKMRAAAREREARRRHERGENAGDIDRIGDV